VTDLLPLTVGLPLPLEKTQLCNGIRLLTRFGTGQVPTSRRDTGSFALVKSQARAAPVSGTATSSAAS
jgi:hypothetical protein